MHVRQSAMCILHWCARVFTVYCTVGSFDDHTHDGIMNVRSKPGYISVARWWYCLGRPLVLSVFLNVKFLERPSFTGSCSKTLLVEVVVLTLLGPGLYKNFLPWRFILTQIFSGLRYKSDDAGLIPEQNQQESSFNWIRYILNIQVMHKVVL